MVSYGSKLEEAMCSSIEGDENMSLVEKILSLAKKDGNVQVE